MAIGLKGVFFCLPLFLYAFESLELGLELGLKIGCCGVHILGPGLDYAFLGSRSRRGHVQEYERSSGT